MTGLGCRSYRHLLDGCAGELLDDLKPTVEPGERNEARSGRGDECESAADTPRARIGHQRDTRGGAPGELHLAQIENHQMSVGLGCSQRPVGLKRRGDVEPPGEHHLDHAQPEVVGDAAKAGPCDARNGAISPSSPVGRGA
jgi:hypothetical protein